VPNIQPVKVLSDSEKEFERFKNGNSQATTESAVCGTFIGESVFDSTAGSGSSRDCTRSIPAPVTSHTSARLKTGQS
jgi:hypothetical protein